MLNESLLHPHPLSCYLPTQSKKKSLGLFSTQSIPYRTHAIIFVLMPSYSQGESRLSIRLYNGSACPEWNKISKSSKRLFTSVIFFTMTNIVDVVAVVETVNWQITRKKIYSGACVLPILLKDFTCHTMQNNSWTLSTLAWFFFFFDRLSNHSKSKLQNARHKHLKLIYN